MNVRIIILMLFVGLLAGGCSNGNETKESAEDSFRLEAKLPDEVQANVPFTIESTLLNDSDRTLEIDYGADLFTYEVRNGEGKLVGQPEQRYVTSIGYSSKLKPEQVLSFDGDGHSSPPANRFTLPEGAYTLTVLAGFSTSDEGKRNNVSITTEPLPFVVE